ncbi:MAG: hypothetical protein YYHSYBAR_000531 [Candidatus Fervidibacter sacchari]
MKCAQQPTICQSLFAAVFGRNLALPVCLPTEVGGYETKPAKAG